MLLDFIATELRHGGRFKPGLPRCIGSCFPRRGSSGLETIRKPRMALYFST
jgi:hypothetical protein